MADTVLTPKRKIGALLTSFEGGKGGEVGAQLREMWFDCTLSESEEVSVDWSEHPIESGATVVDHAVVRQPTLSLEGVITRTPLWMTTEADNLDPNYLDAQLDALRGMVADREPVTVITGLRSYDSYRLTSLSVSRTPDDGQSVRVSISLMPVQIVEAGTVLLPPLPIKPEKKGPASPDADKGSESPKDASGELTPPRKSILKGGLDGSGMSALLGG